MSTALRAKESDLAIWAQGGSYARYDYVTEQYLLAEMLTNDFFGLCGKLLRKGDYILITDAEDQMLMVRVDEIEWGALKVFISKIERLYAIPVVEARAGAPKDDPGLIYRFRPTRAGHHSVVTKDGEVFAILFETKLEAQRCIENCYETGTFAAPKGHEPTAQYVSSNAKIWRAAS